MIKSKMIKGLYFKLNMDKPYDKEIYNFFINESESKDRAKIDILYDTILAYKHGLNRGDIINDNIR